MIHIAMAENGFVHNPIVQNAIAHSVIVHQGNVHNPIVPLVITMPNVEQGSLQEKHGSTWSRS